MGQANGFRRGVLKHEMVFLFVPLDLDTHSECSVAFFGLFIKAKFDKREGVVHRARVLHRFPEADGPICDQADDALAFASELASVMESDAGPPSASGTTTV